MQEALLQLIWELGLFNKKGLTDTLGQKIEILKLGKLNRDSGPDFFDASIKIDGTEWHGHVELHIDGKDWYRHGHEKDRAYNSVILHVVWIDPGEPVRNANGQEVPTLVLKHRIRKDVLDRYEDLKKQRKDPPCGSYLRSVSSLQKRSWFDRLLVERLQSKTMRLAEQFMLFGGDWERLVLWSMTASTGGNFNKENFERLAGLLDLVKIKKFRNNPVRLEAMMLGLAGIIPAKPQDGYTATLAGEFKYMAKMYEWPKERVLWTFGKIRPLALPDRRIAALAATLARKDRWMDWIESLPAEADLPSKFLQPYWWNHYRLDRKMESEQEHGAPGLSRLWLINALIPLSFFYGSQKGDQEIMDKAVEAMIALAPEKNRIVRSFVKWGIKPDSAGDTQAMIHLHKEYCSNWKCLQCHWGISFLRVSDNSGNSLSISEVSESKAKT
jgi:hypothetical protein